jgi:hypothetical protein
MRLQRADQPIVPFQRTVLLSTPLLLPVRDVGLLTFARIPDGRQRFLEIRNRAGHRGFSNN